MTFERTTCGCNECVSCCKRQPGPLAVGDFERIAAAMRLSLADAMPFFRRSPGALVRTIDGSVRRIESIVPAADLSGRCVFLDINDRCQIHAVAPFGCSMFDMHMPPDVAYPRAIWYLRQIEDSPEYQRLRARLQRAKTYQPVTR